MSAVETAQVTKEKKKKKSGVKKSDLPAASRDGEHEADNAAGSEASAPGAGRRKSSLGRRGSSAERRRGSSAAREDDSRLRTSALSRGGQGILSDLDDDKLLELKEAFELFDLDHDGFISFGDLKHTYVTLGQSDVGEQELRKMLSEASNPLDFDAFVQLLGYKTVELDPEEVLMNALSTWDYDNSGLISEERIKHDLMTWGDKFTAKEVEIALEDAPVYVNKNTGVGVIDYMKFCKVLCGLRKKTRDPVVEDFMKH